MKKFIFIVVCLIVVGCNGQNINRSIIKINQDSIIDIYLVNGAWKHSYLEREWGEWIDKGLEKDSTVAYLWQQKAMPYWKQRKYELAEKYYNNAVKYNEERYLCRLGFLKCIFQKNYTSALIDLNQYKTKYGYTYEQDHSNEFWIAICHLQLNEFSKAFDILKNDIIHQETEQSVSWVHYLDRFYLGIIKYELEDYKGAILEFDKALNEYPKFSDAQYYKSRCLNRLGEKEKGENLLILAKLNFDNGYSFKEGSINYEPYPYQITWEWESYRSTIE